jgi:hypothetical protein
MMVAVGLETGFVLPFFTKGFFFAAVLDFGGFLADVLRTDFFKAINNPFYLNEAMVVLSGMGQSKNHSQI